MLGYRFPGNTSDPGSFKTAITRVRADFGIERLIMVGDRGMITGTRIDDLRKLEGMEWVTALKAPATGITLEALTTRLASGAVHAGSPPLAHTIEGAGAPRGMPR